MYGGAGDSRLHQGRSLAGEPGGIDCGLEGGVGGGGAADQLKEASGVRGFGPVHANEPAGMPAALLQHADRQRRGVARNRHCIIDNCLERIEDPLLGVQLFGAL